MPVGRSPPRKPSTSSTGDPSQRPTSVGQGREWSLPSRGMPRSQQLSRTPPPQVQPVQRESAPERSPHQEGLNQEMESATANSPDRRPDAESIPTATHQSEAGTEAMTGATRGIVPPNPLQTGTKPKFPGSKTKPPPADRDWEEAKKRLTSARTEFSRFKNSLVLDPSQLQQLSSQELGHRGERLRALHEGLQGRHIQLRERTGNAEIRAELDARMNEYSEQFWQVLGLLNSETNRRKELRAQLSGEDDDGEEEERQVFLGSEGLANAEGGEEEFDDEDEQQVEARRLEAARREEERRTQRWALYDQRRADQVEADRLLAEEIAANEVQTLGAGACAHLESRRQSTQSSQDGPTHEQHFNRSSTSSVQSTARDGQAASNPQPESEGDFQNDPSVIAMRTRGALRGLTAPSGPATKPGKKQKKKPPKKKGPPTTGRDFQSNADDLVLLMEASRELNWTPERLRTEILKYHTTGVLPQEIVNCQEELMESANSRPVPQDQARGASEHSTSMPRQADTCRTDEINPAVLAAIQQRQDSFRPPPGRTSTTRNPETQPASNERTAHVSSSGPTNPDITRFYQGGLPQSAQTFFNGAQGGASRFAQSRATQEMDRDEVSHNQRGRSNLQVNYRSEGFSDQGRFQSRVTSPPRRDSSQGRGPSFGRFPGRESTRDPPRRDDQRHSRPDEGSASNRSDHQSRDETRRQRGEGSRVFGDHSYIEDGLDLSSPYHQEDYWEFDPDRPMGKTWLRPDRVRFD